VKKTNLQLKELVHEIATRIKTEFEGQSGIVYCFSRKNSEQVAMELKTHDISAFCYHADMEPADKSKVHSAWTKGKLKVIVATVAFGMGIDKPDVRFVIHFSISKSMENYYQESGRAGRDDQPAKCILYFQFPDAFRQSTMVFTEKTGLQNLYNMLHYSIDQKACRRKLIGKHFGEVWDSAKCNEMCDNCVLKKNGVHAMSEKDLYSDAQAIVTILEQAESQDERLTPLKVIDAWLGLGKVSLRLPTKALYSREQCERILTKLIISQIIGEDFHFTPYSTISYLIVGPRWPLLKSKNISVTLYTKGSRTSKIAKKESTMTNVEGNVVQTEEGALPSESGKRKSSSGTNETAAKKKRKAIIIESDDDDDSSDFRV